MKIEKIILLGLAGIAFLGCETKPTYKQLEKAPKVVHEVKQGEWLDRILRKYNWGEDMDIRNVRDYVAKDPYNKEALKSGPDRIYAGYKIRVPIRVKK